MELEDPKTRIIRIPALYYLHVMNRNTNTTRLEVGPKNFICKEHERVVLGPEKMIVVLPRHYIVIENPVIRAGTFSSSFLFSEDENVPAFLRGLVLDEFEQVKLRHGDLEIRFESEDPFPLFPGEKLKQEMTPLQLVAANSALKLKASRDFVDKHSGEKPIKRIAGEEWLLEGPRTYIPQVEVDILETIQATIVKPNQAIKIIARRNCVDSSGKKRRAGDMWLIRREGSYMPGIDEQVMEVVSGMILTDQKAIQLKAISTYTDVYGKERKAGQEWLVTVEDSELHILDVYERFVKEVPLTSISSRQFCIIQNPYNEKNEPQWGIRQLIKGETRFFVRPGEILEMALDIYVLGEEEALELFCQRDFEEHIAGKRIQRKAGQTWLVYGPRDYVPPLQVSVIRKRKAAIQIEAFGLYFLYL